MQPRIICLFVFLSISMFVGRSNGQDDWSQWRGPTGNGIAADGQTPPTQWSLDNNVVWKVKVPGRGHSSPIVVGDQIDGKSQLLISGGKQVAGFNPNTGKKLWSVPASWIVTCGTMVWDGDLVFASGGYPPSQTIAVDVSTGKQVWDNRTKVYEQSMLAFDGYVYAHADNSAIYCWRAKDGKEMWKQRFRSPESVSPVLANGNIYFTDERGNTIVVKATPTQFVEVARNKLGDETFASPAFCGNQIFTRIADSITGTRQEWLVCLGKK